jgi:hypothetical protein
VKVRRQPVAVLRSEIRMDTSWRPMAVFEVDSRVVEGGLTKPQQPAKAPLGFDPTGAALIAARVAAAMAPQSIRKTAGLRTCP